MWRKLAFILMPMALVLNFMINFADMSSPRNIEQFNYPELTLQIVLLVLGMMAIIRSVKTVMLFTCLAYFSFGLSFAYEEVLRETRDVIRKSKLNYINYKDPDAPLEALPLLETYD